MEENIFPSITLPDALAIPGALDIPTPALEQPTAKSQLETPSFR